MTELPASPLAQELTAAGAQPTIVDANALLAQIASLQDRLTAMEAEKGIPSDPIDAARANLQAHVQAHANARPTLDFSEVLKHLEEQATKDGADLIRLLLEDVANQFRAVDLTYVLQLARDLQKVLLK